MLPEILVPTYKSLEQRKREYDFLIYENRSASCMSSIWAEELQLIVEDVQWYAIWKFSLEDCARYQVLYPMSVLVHVESIEFSALSATVTVVGLEEEEDIIFEDFVNVPLFDLIPTKMQKGRVQNFRSIVVILDRLRFFYENLWYPVDLNDNDITVQEWANAHLNNRLSLNSDMEEKKIGRIVVNYIKKIREELNELFYKLHEDHNDVDPTYSEEQKKIQLIRDCKRLEEIKEELDYFENPETREAMVLLKHAELHDDKNDVVLASHRADIDSLTNFLKMAQKIVSKTSTLKIVNDLNAEYLSYKKQILFSPGQYKLFNFELHDTSISGLGGKEDIAISPENISPGRFLFLSCLGKVTLENVSICRNDGGLLLFSQGTVILKNCLLQGNNMKGQGVAAKANCKLEIVECDIRQLHTGILLYEKASATVTSSRISNCTRGLMVMDETSVTLEEIEIASCSTGIFVDTSKQGIATQSDNILILENLPFFTIVANSCQLNGNKVNAAIQYFKSDTQQVIM